MSLSRTVLHDRSYCYCATFLPTCYPPLSLSLLPLVSELLSLSLSLPELTTQEVTTDSINSSYINPAIIAPHACLSAPSSLVTPSFSFTRISSVLPPSIYVGLATCSTNLFVNLLFTVLLLPSNNFLIFIHRHHAQNCN